MSADPETSTMQTEIRELSRRTIEKAREAEKALAEWLSAMTPEEEQK